MNIKEIIDNYLNRNDINSIVSKLQNDRDGAASTNSVVSIDEVEKLKKLYFSDEINEITKQTVFVALTVLPESVKFKSSMHRKLA